MYTRLPSHPLSIVAKVMDDHRVYTNIEAMYVINDT
jgi:hypothetical protein